MIGVKINQAKSMFFDRVVVESKVDRAQIKILSRMGAFVRTSARSSIRKRKKPSKPGKPPSSHTGILKKFIYFGYDAPNRSMVVGPARLNSQSSGRAPSTLEFGGDADIYRRGGKIERIHIEARPYMGPALSKNSPKFPGLWANTVR